ncbi:stage II sporulation protein D [Fictibacillus sp. Mic-4]|uniref:stage II sporulation protein D n=1 Tax=Fictibacillus sp. Mic-4 TaxID=3132826 RepID=UPI003CFBACA6
MNKNVRPIVWIILIFAIVILLIPTLLVLPFSSKHELKGKEVKLKAITSHEHSTSDFAVAVYRTGEKKTEKVPLEDYIQGVVASEMPAEFEMEALKAQALTARTFVVKRLLHPSTTLPNHAVLTDSISDQVYKSKAELKKQWGKDYDRKMKKIARAVKETQGEILTYKGEPITASFFSTSNGYTENSKDYWGSSYPYLKSVKSPWDLDSPKYVQQEAIPLSTFEQKLGVTIENDGVVGKVEAKTEGNRIGKIVIDGKKFTGREIREKLQLRSADFTLIKKGDKVIASTRGYGHGVGMSQYGANGIAKEGKTYKDIVSYYYKGVSITNYTPSDIRAMAKK